MDFLTDLTDIRTIQWLACAASCMLAFILMIIKIPHTEYAKRLNTAKVTIAVSFLVCGFMMAFSLYKYPSVWGYETFSSITMLITASFSTMAISYSMINILDEKAVTGNTFVINAFLLAASSFALIEAFLGENNRLHFIIALTAALLLFVSQSIYYIVKFDKAYRKSLKILSAYYDEDEDHKIRWLRFCYIIAMLTDIFLLVYMLLHNGFMKVYIAWYILFILYFSANFISFLGSHKMVLDAFAHRTLSGQDLFPPKTQKLKEQEPAIDRKQRETEFRTISRNIKQWVADKKYREYDKTREEIAEEMGTTKEMLQLFFNIKIKQDFRNWRTELRINDAKRMLLEDRQASTNLIGEMCGFSDRSNFHTQFVKLVGCSPKKWRETEGKPDSAS